MRHIQRLGYLAISFLVLSAGVVMAKGPMVEYKIRIDPAALSGFDVEMRFTATVPVTRVAMAAHTEYDDRYYRYIENFSAASGGRPLIVSKPDPAVWQIGEAKGDVLVKYRLRLPVQNGGSYRDAWKPFLTPTGGMVGDLHSLMYIVGGESRPASLTLDMPAAWTAASGLEPTRNPRTFTGSTELLLDAPVMIGSLTEHKFTAGGVPHSVVIWSPPDAKPYDAGPLISGVEKIANESIKAFGRPPYPRYAFLLQNGGSAALEHMTSVNLGLPADLGELFQELAHEYIHVWNLMDVRPRERIGLKYKFAEPTGVLWWNEGATIFFADLVLRRAGLGEQRNRVQRLESLIARYMNGPGYSVLSAEQISRGDSHPLLLGDYFASTHLQGEVLTTLLDLKIRDATDGRRNTTDAMRLLAAKFDWDHGITNDDIKSALQEVCDCAMDEFFRDHIYGAKRADLDPYLRLIGLRSTVRWIPAVDADGKPIADTRIGPISGEGELALRITNPQSAWGRAGLHTGDKLISVNGSPVADWTDLRNWLRRIRIGDTAHLEIVRDGAGRTIDVPIAGYDVPQATITELPENTPRQIKLRTEWMNAK